ncbi:MAG: hypothetical protein ACLP0A_02775, partial [Verrucomicrobiia bacterium]
PIMAPTARYASATGDQREIDGVTIFNPFRQPSARAAATTECVDHPNRRISRHIVLNRRRQQRRLTTILAPNVAHEKGRIVVDAAHLI